MQKIVHPADGTLSGSTPVGRQSSFPQSIKTLIVLVVLFTIGFVGPARANTGFWKDFVILSYGGDNIYYKTIAPGDVPNIPFQNNNLGRIDRGNGRVILNGGEANTFQNDGDDVTATRMFYRVYRQGTAPTTAFAPLEFTFRNLASNGDKKWDNTNAGVNLLASVVENGTYVLEVFFQGNGRKTGIPNFELYDSNNGNNYRATFEVYGSDPTVWTGRRDTNWFEQANWTNGVPNRDKDAIIPVQPSGGNRFPILTQGGETARTRNLLIDGVDVTRRALLSLDAGTLAVYGDFRNPTSGFQQGGDAVFVLAAEGNQSFDGAVFTQISISGSGLKTLTNRMDVQLNLLFNGGILVTNTANATQFNVTMLGQGIIGTPNAQQRETETSYLRGYLVTRRSIADNASSTFGNIGLTLTATGKGPGETLITRLTGISYSNVGDNTNASIQRSFNVVPTVNEGLNVRLDFRYLDVELNGLREAGLTLYRSENTGRSFTKEGRDDINNNPNIATNTLTKSNLTTLSLFTLSEALNPLPVALTSFTATRQGNNAIISWATAQETNNKGFDVQVSADGKEFRTLATVPAVSANSSTGNAYQYRDTEGGKNGIRYYRLQQVDLDGTVTFYGPRSLTFEGAVAKLEVAPNPFTATIAFTAQTEAAGNAVVQLTDMNGRVVREQTLALGKGISTVSVDNLSSLSNGIYFVKLNLPDGQVQRQKIVKN